MAVSRRRTAEQVRQALVDAYERLRAAGGAPTLEQVADEAGVSRRLISSAETRYGEIRRRILEGRPKAAVPPRGKGPRRPPPPEVELREENNQLKRTLRRNAAAMAALIAHQAGSAGRNARERNLEERRRNREQRDRSERAIS